MKKTLLTLLFFVTSYSIFAQAVVSGEEFRKATLSSIDILTHHLQILQAQNKYKKALNFYSFTYRTAPVKKLLNDGSTVDGSISRVLNPMGFGFGNPDKFCFFSGASLDIILNKISENEYSQTNMYEGLLYAGIGLGGFQITAGYLQSVGEGLALDGNHDFPADSLGTSTAANEELDSRDRSTYYTFYHKSGVYVALIYERLKNTTGDEKELSEVKFHFQPLKHYLPNFFGLPFVEILKLDPLKSYYNETDDIYFNNDADADANPKANPYETSFGSDNIMKTGIRSSLTLQVKPTVVFRKAELSYYNSRKATESSKTSLGYGSRLQLYMSNNQPKTCFDLFMMFSIKENTHFSLSYSYNSPDNTTFIPLPDLHVIGLQMIFGKRETAKAITPFTTTALDNSN